MAIGSHSDDVDDCSVAAARTSALIGHQRRQELEQEIAELQNVLKNEEKVREVLERAMLPDDGRSPFHIPSFLPKKTKELLAELVMVEEEVARLEREISKIEKCSSQLQEVNRNELTAIKLNKQSRRTLAFLPQILIPPADATNSILIEEKIALETKPMFFINQAIRGDYSLHGFTGNTKLDNKANAVKKKEARKVSDLQERNTRKSDVTEKQCLPKPPRHPSPRPSDTNIEILFKYLRNPSTGINPKEKYGQKLQPNKLSEKIVKCLLCIFLRLIRTSRVSELEKSGNLSRSPSYFLRSTSSQGENGLNTNTMLVNQKETGRRDPFRVFEFEDSLIRDIGPYKNLVQCTSSSLDVRSISSCLQLLSELRGLLNNLREVDLRFLTHHQKLAFWINVYNTCIMHGFLQQGLPSSHDKIVALKSKAMLDIGGNKLNAGTIEHFILRQQTNSDSIWKGDKDDKEEAVRSIHGLERSEANITFALSCGNRSSPSVRIYTADSVSAELEKSKLEYLQACIVVTASKRLKIPKLLVANMHDFATDLVSLVEWICNQLPASGSLRKSMAECLRCHSNREEISDIIDIIPYDFEFQYLFPQ